MPQEFIDSGLVTAGAAAALVVLTCLLAWIGWKQIKLTRILQRAYVSADAGGIRTSMEGYLYASVIFRNVGHLPASRVAWVIEPIEVTGNNDWHPPAKGSPLRGQSILPLGGKMTVGSARILQQKIEECAGDAKYLYVWGRASYRDGFGKRRKTSFCHRYNWGAREVPANGKIHIGAEHARFHDFGNDAD
jgi:hypothetical protein